MEEGRLVPLVSKSFSLVLVGVNAVIVLYYNVVGGPSHDYHR